jgi:molecular chaperone DnaK
VTAKDKTSGKEQKITIQNSTNLSEEEVEKMKADAEKHAEEDKQRKENIEARNHANSVAFEIEKQLKEYGDKLDEKDRKEIEENVKKLKELAAKEDSTKAIIDPAVDEMFKSAQKIGEAMQKAGATPGAEAAGGASEAGADAKEDAKKDDKKGEAEEGEVVKE